MRLRVTLLVNCIIFLCMPCTPSSKNWNEFPYILCSPRFVFLGEHLSESFPSYISQAISGVSQPPFPTGPGCVVTGHSCQLAPEPSPESSSLISHGCLNSQLQMTKLYPLEQPQGMRGHNPMPLLTHKMPSPPKDKTTPHTSEDLRDLEVCFTL